MRPQAIGAVNNGSRRARAAIEREIAENRLTVVRVVIDANRIVVGEYRARFVTHAARTPAARTRRRDTMTFPLRHPTTGRICCSTPRGCAPAAPPRSPPPVWRARRSRRSCCARRGRRYDAPQQRGRQRADLQALEAENRAASGDSFAAPDPYAAGIKKLQEASATPASKFEDRYRAERQAEYLAEYARQKEMR